MILIDDSFVFYQLCVAPLTALFRLQCEERMNTFISIAVENNIGKENEAGLIVL